MRGRLTTWNDNRGFGFISPDGGGERVFVHISGFERGIDRPTPGLVVNYRVAHASDGRARAVGVTGPRVVRRSRSKSSALLPTLVVFATAALLVWLVLNWDLNGWILVAYAAVSWVTFFVYYFDKRAARTGGWRISENTLLLLGLIGGWPGAILAQQSLRHKNAKPSFQGAFWVTVLVNIGGLVAVTACLRFG